MATMDRTQGKAAPRSVPERRRLRIPSRSASLTVHGTAALLASFCGPAALAQQWSVIESASAQATWTSNADIGSANGREDFVLNARPRVDLRREGARLRLSGYLLLNAYSYANGTQPSRVLPEADVNAHVEAVERLVYVDGEARALQTSQNPFGANPSGNTANSNTVTTTVVRLSPYISKSVSPTFRYNLRSDNVRTGANGSAIGETPSSARSTFGHHTALIEQDPVPLGWRLEAERSDTRFSDSTQPPLRLDLARLNVDYALWGQELSVGLRGGYERNSLLGTQQKNSIYGAQLRWRPTDRTQLTAYDEHRFFGSGWRLGFDHRMPWLAWNLVMSRSVETAPQLLFELPAGSNVAALLDAMFTTRYPDPAERARVVRDFMTSRGLPDGTFQPTSLYTQQLSLVTYRSASIGYIGPRSSVTLSAYHRRVQDALAAEVLPVAPTAINNNTGYGGSVVITHRLSPVTTLNLQLDYARLRALRSISLDDTKQAAASLRVIMQASPKTGVFFGGRYRKLGSNAVQGGDETSVTAGLDHTF